MEHSKDSAQSTAWGWEQKLIDDYYNHRWHQTLEPLCEWLRLWKEGELAHSQMETVLEDTHRQICEVRSLFSQRPDRLVLLVQALDREWFARWVVDHAPPPDVQLVPSAE
jgi:hypothetical protein